VFTGIIESFAKVHSISKNGTNSTFCLESNLASQLKVDQSLSHNGVCLTVEKIEGHFYYVTAIQETLLRSNLGHWVQGTLINIERCMPAHGRFDGHIVQGHVDQTAICTQIKNANGSWIFNFEYDPSIGNITVQKGSICINGVSLTVVDSTDNGFSVAIIPYTFEHTNFKTLQVGQTVNLEFDIVGKYIQQMMAKRN
jgi:riboflavin synthase